MVIDIKCRTFHTIQPSPRDISDAGPKSLHVISKLNFCGNFSTSPTQTICWFRDLGVKVPRELSERHQVLYLVTLHEIQTLST